MTFSKTLIYIFSLKVKVLFRVIHEFAIESVKLTFLRIFFYKFSHYTLEHDFFERGSAVLQKLSLSFQCLINMWS